MAGESGWIDGTELPIETAGVELSTGEFAEMADDDRQPADSAGFKFGRFEIDNETTGFSAAPTDGAVFNIYEQTINSDGTAAPAPAADNIDGFIGSIGVAASDAQQFLVSQPLPLNKTGGKYWVEWVDGGAGVVTVDSGWVARLILTTEGPLP